MNNRHRKILRALFPDKISACISWKDIESVFLAFGGIIQEGRGSRVCFIWGDRLAVFHRPHPQPDADKGAIKSVRRYFEAIGLKQ